MNRETIQLLQHFLEGGKCTGIELNNGWLQILFSDQRMVIQSAWRLVHEINIALSIDDHTETTHSYELAVRLLKGNTVRTVIVTPPFHDIELQFENEVFVQAYSNSSQYENWSFFAEPQEIIVAGPNTSWSCFRTQTEPSSSACP